MVRNVLLKSIPKTIKGLESQNSILQKEIARLEGRKTCDVEYLQDEVVVEEVNGFSIYDGKENIFCIDSANKLYVYSKAGLGIDGSNVDYDELDSAIDTMFLDADEIKESIIPFESVDRFEDPMSASTELNEMWSYINGVSILDAPEGFFITDENDNVEPLTVEKTKVYA